MIMVLIFDFMSLSNFLSMFGGYGNIYEIL